MPKVILTFNLPDEQPEFEAARRGAEYYSVLWKICDQMYKYRRYGLPTGYNNKKALAFFQHLDLQIRELIENIPELP